MFKAFGSLMLLALALPMQAEPSGFTGRTSAQVGGCGFCHGSAVNAATTVTLQGGTPSTVLPGSVTTFTIVVAHATQRVAGVNIAVMTTPTGDIPAGTLAAITGQRTKLIDGEITHSSPKQMVNGEATYSFTWTAPATEGTYYLQAVGNACNGDGREDDQDHWSFLEAVPIVVSLASDVADAETQAPSLTITPNMVLHGVPANASRVAVVSIAGMVVYEREMPMDASERPVVIPELPSGMYAVLVETRSGMVSLPFVVVR